MTEDRSAAFPAPASEDRCPCLSGETYGSCCGKYHSGQQPAPTAVALMRSRYSAFAVGQVQYLLDTWHPSTRPAVLELDTDLRWRRLDIVDTTAGGPLDASGVVRFRAHYRAGVERGIQEETSRFTRSNGKWLYLDGE